MIRLKKIYELKGVWKVRQLGWNKKVKNCQKWVVRRIYWNWKRKLSKNKIRKRKFILIHSRNNLTEQYN